MIKIKSRKAAIFIVILVVILITVILLSAGLYKTKLNKTTAPNIPNTQSTTQPKRLLPNKTTESSQPAVSPVKNLNIQSGIKSSFKTIELKPASGNQGSGTAIMVQEEGGGQFAVVIETQLKDPSDNTNYTAWLKSKNSNKNIKIGQLQKIQNNYSLSVTQNGIFTDYLSIFISLEKQNDNQTEKPILEGTL